MLSPWSNFLIIWNCKFQGETQNLFMLLFTDNEDPMIAICKALFYNGKMQFILLKAAFELEVFCTQNEANRSTSLDTGDST